jgi:hypothetical protein
VLPRIRLHKDINPSPSMGEVGLPAMLFGGERVVAYDGSQEVRCKARMTSSSLSCFTPSPESPPVEVYRQGRWDSVGLFRSDNEGFVRSNENFRLNNAIFIANNENFLACPASFSGGPRQRREKESITGQAKVMKKWNSSRRARTTSCPIFWYGTHRPGGAKDEKMLWVEEAVHRLLQKQSTL